MYEVDPRGYWNRVREKMEEEKVPLNSLALAISSPVYTVYSWTSKNRIPPADKCALIALVLNVNPLWLLFGDQAPDPESLRLAAGVASSMEAQKKRMKGAEFAKLEAELEALKKKLNAVAAE